MGRNIGKIYETEEYDKFNYLKGNRKVKKNSSLERSILKNGMLIPIAVNENFEILDGQSRFEIAKKYGKKVFYRINNGFGMDEVIDLNNTKKAWKLEDYINKYVVDQNPEYEKLQKVFQKYPNIPLSALTVAAQGLLDLTSQASANVREGMFEFYNYPNFCVFLEDYYEFIKHINIKGTLYTFLAYFNLYTIKKFDKERLMKNMMGKQELVNEIMSLDIVIEVFLKAHNYRLRGQVYRGNAIKYELSKKEKPIIMEERNFLLYRMD
ncbi:ParB N-terminal domain-containing protein [Enterococcus sp. AZ192]|uniref:ParB N-terminal domain-containing protein n=1 Tax=unclassified Enterococcus TaxID=2608891 RepID=UPI003D29BD19